MIKMISFPNQTVVSVKLSRKLCNCGRKDFTGSKSQNYIENSRIELDWIRSFINIRAAALRS